MTMHTFAACAHNSLLCRFSPLFDFAHNFVKGFISKDHFPLLSVISMSARFQIIIGCVKFYWDIGSFFRYIF